MSQARQGVKGEAVRRELVPEQSIELLRELHLVTRDGNLNADARRKLKQVNHLIGLLKPALEDVWARFGNPVLVDAGSGNAYLGFILYELWMKGSDKGELWCIESRPELTQRARERAERLGYTRMRFVDGHIDQVQSQLPERVNVVTALHACDTATDDAMALAFAKNADHVALVPCCQAEIAAQLKANKEQASESMRSLFEHAWHRREFGSHLTNVLRALALESQGYAVTVTELTGWEHSLKNELHLGRRVHRESRPARARLDRLVQDSGVEPKIVRQLRAASKVSSPAT